MTLGRLLVASVLAGACASGRAGTAAAPAPAPSAAAPIQPTPPSPPPASASASVRYGPGAQRYLVHRQLHIQQTLGDLFLAKRRAPRSTLFPYTTLALRT